MRRNGYFYHFSEVIWKFARDDVEYNCAEVMIAEICNPCHLCKLWETEGFRNGDERSTSSALLAKPPEEGDFIIT